MEQGTGHPKAGGCAHDDFWILTVYQTEYPDAPLMAHFVFPPTKTANRSKTMSMKHSHMPRLTNTAANHADDLLLCLLGLGKQQPNRCGSCRVRTKMCHGIRYPDACGRWGYSWYSVSVEMPVAVPPFSAAKSSSAMCLQGVPSSA